MTHRRSRRPLSAAARIRRARRVRLSVTIAVVVLSVVTAVISIAAWQVPRLQSGTDLSSGLQLDLVPDRQESVQAYGSDVHVTLSESRDLWQEMGIGRELVVKISLQFLVPRNDDADPAWHIVSNLPFTATPAGYTYPDTTDASKFEDITGWTVSTRAQYALPLHVRRLDTDPGSDYRLVFLQGSFKVTSPVVSQGEDEDGSVVQSWRVSWNPQLPSTWSTEEDTDGDGLIDTYSDAPNAQVEIRLCDECDVHAVYSRTQSERLSRGSQTWLIPVTRHDDFEFSTGWRPWVVLRGTIGWFWLTILAAVIGLGVEFVLRRLRPPP